MSVYTTVIEILESNLKDYKQAYKIAELGLNEELKNLETLNALKEELKSAISNIKRTKSAVLLKEFQKIKSEIAQLDAIIKNKNRTIAQLRGYVEHNSKRIKETNELIESAKLKLKKTGVVIQFKKNEKNKTR